MVPAVRSPPSKSHPTAAEAPDASRFRNQKLRAADRQERSALEPISNALPLLGSFWGGPATALLCAPRPLRTQSKARVRLIRQRFAFLGQKLRRRDEAQQGPPLGRKSIPAVESNASNVPSVAEPGNQHKLFFPANKILEREKGHSPSVANRPCKQVERQPGRQTDR